MSELMLQVWRMHRAEWERIWRYCAVTKRKKLGACDERRIRHIYEFMLNHSDLVEREPLPTTICVGKERFLHLTEILAFVEHQRVILGRFYASNWKDSNDSRFEQLELFMEGEK